LLRTRIRCGNAREVFVLAGGLHSDMGDYASFHVGGGEAIVVPVLGANASDYERLVSDGFLLTWDPPPLARKLVLLTCMVLGATRSSYIPVELHWFSRVD
jgi:hypothetical protein